MAQQNTTPDSAPPTFLAVIGCLAAVLTLAGILAVGFREATLRLLGSVVEAVAVAMNAGVTLTAWTLGALLAAVLGCVLTDVIWLVAGLVQSRRRLRQAIARCGLPREETIMGGRPGSSIDASFVQIWDEALVSAYGLAARALEPAQRNEARELLGAKMAKRSNREWLHREFTGPIRERHMRGDPRFTRLGLEYIKRRRRKPMWITRRVLHVVTGKRLGLGKEMAWSTLDRQSLFDRRNYPHFAEEELWPRLAEYDQYLLRPMPAVQVLPAAATPTLELRPAFGLGPEARSDGPSSTPAPEGEQEPEPEPSLDPELVKKGEQQLDDIELRLADAGAWASLEPEKLVEECEQAAQEVLAKLPGHARAVEMAAKLDAIAEELPQFKAWLDAAMEMDHERWPVAINRALQDCGEALGPEQLRRHAARRYLTGPASEREPVASGEPQLAATVEPTEGLESANEEPDTSTLTDVMPPEWQKAEQLF